MRTPYIYDVAAWPAAVLAGVAALYAGQRLLRLALLALLAWEGSR